MKYGHEWHLRIQVQLAAAAQMIPIYHIGPEDPRVIVELKKLLELHKHQLDKTVQTLNEKVIKEYEKEHNTKSMFSL